MTAPYSRFLTEIGFAETTAPAIQPVWRADTPARRVRRRDFPRLLLTMLLLTILLLVPALAVSQDTPANFDDVSAAAATEAGNWS